MSYQLPADLETEFALRLSSGHYASMEEVLRHALSALDWRDREIAAIQEGIDAMETGDVRPIKEFDREFRAARGISLDM
jgi:Arc/MetJ-type ribon-helix-helix transcriptional regulator